MSGTPNSHANYLASGALMRPMFSWSSILSVRGAIILLLGVYLILGPALRDKDIIATVVGGAFIFVVLSSILITALSVWRLRRTLKASFAAPENVANFAEARALVPKTPLLLISSLNAVTVPPGFILNLQLNFEHDGVLTAVHALTGKHSGIQRLSELVTIPHRGDWRPHDFVFSFGDRFGICLASWSVQATATSPTVRVYPPRSEGNSIPVMSSCHRPGDDLVDTNNREGDLFDLKRYHPSDGVNRILWKLYAKSGELISRHPESAVAPEGQVVLFALVRPQDDAVCSELVAYLRKLERHGLEVLVGCCGMGDRPAARSSTQAEELLIESVWNGATLSQLEMLQEVERFMANVRSRDLELRFDRVLLFFEGELFNSSSDVSFAAAIGDQLSNSGIEPVFVVRRPDNAFEIGQRRGRAQTNSISEYLAVIRNLFIAAPSDENAANGECFGEFLSLCLRRQWQLVSP